MTTTTKSSDTSSKKIKIFHVFNYAKDEKKVFWMSDIFLGTFALWLPLLLGLIFYTKTSFCAELVKLLDAGSGYTFALPFLAASSSFIFLEQKKKDVDDLRNKLAPNIFIYCSLLAIFGFILTGIHFTASIFDKNSSRCLLNLIQSIFVILTIDLGLNLFCLKNVDKLPDELKKYLSVEKEKAAEIFQQAKNRDSF
jgi:hypothetical protein